MPEKKALVAAPQQQERWRLIRCVCENFLNEACPKVAKERSSGERNTENEHAEARQYAELKVFKTRTVINIVQSMGERGNGKMGRC